MENKIDKIIPHVPEEEICDKKQEYLKRDLEAIFDAMKEDEKKGVTKEFWVKEQMEQGNDDEYFDKDRETRVDELAKKNKELKESRYDSATGLEKREGLYYIIEKKIREVFNIKTEGKLSDEEWINIFKNCDTNKIEENNYVAFGDISFLSLANDSSHDSGDDLLKEVANMVKGKMIQEERFKAFRHGGDEFTFSFLDMSEEEVKKILSEIKRNLNKIKDFDGLKEYDFSLNMDMGFASMKESVEIFKEVLKNEQVFKEWKEEDKKEIRNRKTPRTVIDRFEDVWVAVADKRAFIEKGRERLPLLIDIYKKDNSKKKDVYTELFTFLGKGGYKISEKDLLSLMNEEKEKQSEAIEVFIRKEEKKSLEKLNGYNRIRADIIAKKIDIL